MHTLLVKNKESKGGPKASSGLALLLIAFFLLTTCPIKESISLLIIGKSSIENFGLNDHKNISQSTSRVEGEQVCSVTGLSSVDAEIPSKLASSTFMSASLVFLLLIPAFSFRSLFLKGLHRYDSKAIFTEGLSPIYIRNRRLLI